MPAPPGGTAGFPVSGATQGPNDETKNKHVHDADKRNWTESCGESGTSGTWGTWVEEVWKLPNF